MRSAKYVPVHGHYVNPPDVERPAAGALIGIGLTGLALCLLAAVCVWAALTGFSPTPSGTPSSWVTPTTYGPPPTGGVR